MSKRLIIILYLKNRTHSNIFSGNIKNLFEAVNKIYKKIRELDVSVAELESMSHEHTSSSDQRTSDRYATDQTAPTTATSTTYTTETTFESSGEESYDGNRYKREAEDSGAG